MVRQALRLGAVLLALALALSLLCQFAAALFWFEEVQYTEVFWLRFKTQASIWAIVSIISILFLASNLALAQRLKYPRDSQAVETPRVTVFPDSRRPVLRIPGLTVPLRPDRRYATPATPSIPLIGLLPLALVLTVAIGLLLLQQGQAALTAWTSDLNQLNGLPALPDRPGFSTLWTVGQMFLAGATNPLIYLAVGLLVVSAIGVLINPTALLTGLAGVVSLGMGFILSAYWGRVLQCFYATPFNQGEPLFSRDVAFYVFTLPIWQLLEFWLVHLVLFGLLAVALFYLLSGDSLSQGQFVGFSPLQQRHLSALGGCLLVMTSVGSWISRYELLYSTRGATFGAGYTDVHVLLPAYTVLSVLAGAIALLLFWQAGRPVKVIPRHVTSVEPLRRSTDNTSARYASRPVATTPIAADIPRWQRQRWWLNPLILLGCYGAIAVSSTMVLPLVVQRLVVQPNELARETPYIRHSIALTQGAFDLDSIDRETFNPTGTLTFNELLNNQTTIRNIRLWDTRPLLQTNRQLQQIRPYYRFFDADVDRYQLPASEQRQATGLPQNLADSSRAAPITQQVLIAARELDYTAVPQEAQTWVNEHLVYTHGYGFTLSPVNQVADGGLPDYYVKDIGVNAADSGGSLTTSDTAIRNTIPIAHPRIYYGELANTYILTGTQVQELDYPSGNDNVYNTYDGKGGINVGPLWRRWLLAGYLRDWRMLLANTVTANTKLLFRRNINDRLHAIAPFLQFDRDPYLVVANIGQSGLENAPEPTTQTPNYLYWIVDAYTTSDHYPYSDPGQVTAVNGVTTQPQSARLNYIRNSVKAVIDAYNGSVRFYVAEPDEPIIRTWSAIFPNLFRPLSEMPAPLVSHIRYPLDLFNVQAERLTLYHMTDPQVFYNREDLWKVPTEIYGNQPQLVEPYYLITKLPIGKTEEFILLLPYTPNQRTNLTAWLAARSDGKNYGKSLLYVFPKQQLVYGTEQIEARINQDPVISQQISLWNRAGSRAIQGNLLVIPIEQSLLYIEPLYLEAEQNSLPTLVRVIAAYENRIAMAPTLEQAIRAVFQPPTTTAPAIVRPVE